MTKVIFIRHGETEWNILGKYQGQTDVPLTEKGREQGKLLAKYFPFDSLDAIYSSDLTRAVETAGFVAEKFNLSVQKEKDFREMNFGDWEGLTYKEISAKYVDANRSHHAPPTRGLALRRSVDTSASCASLEGIELFFTRPDILKVPNGENFKILQERATKRLYELIKIHDGETIAITAHGGILRTIIADALEMPLKNIWRIRQSNTAVSIITYAENPVVEFINNTEHLRRG